MPHQPNLQLLSKSEQITQSGRTATRILKEIADATKSSYLRGLAGVGSLIFETLENVKSNKEKCLLMTEQVYELLCVVINSCKNAIELAPAFLHSITVLTSTLHKVVSFMREHTGGNLVKRFLHQHQTTTLLGECKSSLQHALAIFKLQSGVMTAAKMTEMQATAIMRHKELLALANQPNDIDRLRELRRNSSSVSVLLPAAPKIMHGRQQELNHIINTLHKKNTQVAILGAGGIGKTSLAQAILHHSNIVAQYCSQRYWIACNSAESASDLMFIIATYFEVNTQPNRLHAFLHCLQSMPAPILLVLDNLETPWEEPSQRHEVEELLSHLTGLENLSLVITMRGAERPRQVQWTRPFLPPLGPISAEAARQTFLDISDIDESDPQLEQLLSLTDNIPLVVSLLASVAESEGSIMTLARWKSEQTSLLSAGFDKHNNLEKSIEVSLHSGRFQSVPHAKDLLSILSYLPDGITSVEFDQLQLPLSDFTQCRSTLCRTSLAYVTPEHRLKLLAPVKDYIQKSYPPSASTIIAIRMYFFDLVKLAGQISNIPSLVQKFASNIGNIHFTIRMALKDPNPMLGKIVLKQLLNLINIYSITQVGSFDLLKSCGSFMNIMTDDLQLHGYNCMAKYWTIPAYEIKHAEAVYHESIKHFQQANDLVGLSWAYQLTSHHYQVRQGDHIRSPNLGLPAYCRISATVW
ncbi:P-loop containing nucleoside triphosphate hydrolase protein [Mycena floridula]|nr:P-loop containing nucleoside triphosphate hydrolase protein [Mycena floridula]